MALKRIICTHNGQFHCDDVFACCLVKFLPKFKDAKIIRTRDENLISNADIVLDVGSIYDPTKNRFDHHQREFQLTIKDLNPSLNHSIRLSSAGLVYHHFGKEILTQILQNFNSETNDDKINALYENIYKNFVLEIDAIDNGVNVGENLKYEIKTGISSRIGRFNLNWNDQDFKSEEKIYEKFLQAIDYIREEFLGIVRNLNNVWWPAKDLVKQAILNRKKVHESGAIIEFTDKIVPPYINFLFLIEKELGIEGEIKYCLYEDGNQYRIRAIPVTPDSFENRIPIIEEWRGLRDEKLQEISGNPDFQFVHASGFTGGAKNRNSALIMAVKSLMRGPK